MYRHTEMDLSRDDSANIYQITFNGKDIAKFLEYAKDVRDKKIRLKYISSEPNLFGVVIDAIKNNVEELYVENLTDLSPLEMCKNLNALHMRGLKIRRFSPVLPGLKKLRIDNCYYIEDFANLAACTQLEELEISGSMIEELDPLKKLTQLERLKLVACECVRDVAPLENSRLKDLCIRAEDRPYICLQNMEMLDYRYMEKLDLCGIKNDIWFLRLAHRLKSLKLEQMYGLNFKGLEGCESLLSLYIEGCTISSLSTLDCSRLAYIDITSSQVKSISGIEKCTNLQRIKFSGVLDLLSMRGLDACSNLKHMEVFCGSGISTTECNRVAREISRLKNVVPVITTCDEHFVAYWN